MFKVTIHLKDGVVQHQFKTSGQALEYLRKSSKHPDFKRGRIHNTVTGKKVAVN